MLHTHAQRLDRWLGNGVAEGISKKMQGWYGNPIPLGNVPGRVWVNGHGEFVGPIRAGHFTNVLDYTTGRMARVLRGFARGQLSTANMGFSSLGDLINEATVNGKRQDMLFSKAGSTAVQGIACGLFNNFGMPVAGGVGGTSGTGRALTSSTAGALGQSDAAGGDTLHLVNAYVVATSAGQTLGMCDRLWDMTYNHASSTNTAIDSANRPTRYTTAPDTIGNFLAAEITTTIAATSHTLTITYVDQDGNAAEAAFGQTFSISTAPPVFWPASIGGSGWYWPLNGGDRGLKYLTNMAQNTTSSVTGIQTWWIGHMLGIFPCPAAFFPMQMDGINTAFNLTRILDGAAVTFFELTKRSTTSSNYNGLVTMVSG